MSMLAKKGIVRLLTTQNFKKLQSNHQKIIFLNKTLALNATDFCLLVYYNQDHYQEIMESY